MSTNLPLKKINLDLEIPVEWLSKIEALAEENQLTLAEIMVNLMGENLNLDPEKLNYLRLHKNHQELAERLAILESKDYQIEKLNHRLEILEKLVTQLQHPQVSPRRQLLNLPTNNDDDDIEDEPDEILTDFMLD